MMKKPNIQARLTTSADMTTDILGTVVKDSTKYTEPEIVLAMKTNIMKSFLEKGIIDTHIPEILDRINDGILLELFDHPDNIYTAGVIINYIVANLAMCGIYPSDIYSIAQDTIHDIRIKICIIRKIS